MDFNKGGRHESTVRSSGCTMKVEFDWLKVPGAGYFSVRSYDKPSIFTESIQLTSSTTLRSAITFQQRRLNARTFPKISQQLGL